MTPGAPRLYERALGSQTVPVGRFEISNRTKLLRVKLGNHTPTNLFSIHRPVLHGKDIKISTYIDFRAIYLLVRNIPVTWVMLEVQNDERTMT